MKLYCTNLTERCSMDVGCRSGAEEKSAGILIVGERNER
jgi:hypothetical protein